MKVFIVLCLLLNPFHNALAGFYFSPGAAVSFPHESMEKSPENEALISFDQGLGLSLDLEYRSNIFSIILGALWKGSEAISQYSYTNPHDPFDTGTVANLKTNTTTLQLFFGPRIRFINTKYFSSFIGGGLNRGFLYLTYNEDQFILATGGKMGFREGEDRDLKGYYYEGGIEFTSSRGGILRILARRSETESLPFISLGDTPLTITNTQLTLQYAHPF